MTFKRHPRAQHRRGRQPRDVAALGIVLAIHDLLRVGAIGRVLHVEIQIQRRAPPLKTIFDAQIELHKIGQAGRVLRAEQRLVGVIARVVEGAADGGARKAARPAQPHAEAELAPRPARHHLQHVSLIVVEEARFSRRMVAPFAARQRVADPAGQAAPGTCAQEQLPAVDASWIPSCTSACPTGGEGQRAAPTPGRRAT